MSAFCQGHPTAIYPIFREERAQNSRNRPNDTALVRNAKTALEVAAFTSAASQTAVEFSKNTANNRITRAEARYRAETKLSESVWMGERNADEDRKASLFLGLIDRGRRKVATFFDATKPGDVAKLQAKETAIRLRELGTGGAASIEADNVARTREFARHEARTKAHETAMYRWARNVDDGQPIDYADGIDIANAQMVRASSHNLMRLAIEGDVNPSDSHRNLEGMRNAFETGRKVGRLLRGASVTISPLDAEILIAAIDTVKCEHIATEADAASFYLADAMQKSFSPNNG